MYFVVHTYKTVLAFLNNLYANAASKMVIQLAATIAKAKVENKIKDRNLEMMLFIGISYIYSEICVFIICVASDLL